MPSTSRTESISTGDGTYDGLLVVPDDPNGAGILLLQEIFGVGEFLVDRATALAEEGYVVLCPDVFWRVERNVALPHDEESLGKAFAIAHQFSQIDPAVTASDLTAALDHLKRLPETTGLVAVMGYCLGGRLAYEVAVAADPACCVSYYGSGIADRLDAAHQISCPVLFHFGGADPYIPAEQAEQVRQAFAERGDVEVHVQEDAGHAFENSFSTQFSNPAATAQSWPLTLSWLSRWLQGSSASH
ncbi:MAG: dienelactone hydrolase family protein [Acidimicrobiales bacterium]|jgi:carboxymethylenebutenolidase